MPSQFPCPHCQAPLRIRNRAYLGKELDCPHCDQPIRIVAGIDTEFLAEPLGEPELPIPMEARNHLWTPQRISWALAASLGLLLMGVLFWPNQESSKITAEKDLPSKNPTRADEDTGTPPVETPVETDEPPTVVDDPAPPVVEVPVVPVAIVEENGDPPKIDVPLPAPPEPNDPPEMQAALDQPIEPMFAADVAIEPAVVVDVQQALDVRVKRFDQPRPIAVREILTEFEEFLGVPIRTADPRIPPAQLDRTVTILLEDTTLGEILKSVTEQAGLSFEIQDGEIVLIPSQE
ncbi:hypothetical protein [Thalassoroseus pseudoceratinae]|uniref:hypothetical protein n=1 Tax=Thalassoroseus pseudoceratinae TaxID=2713176 RepID=UPI0014220F29|nr:hypothetical protein [Thalassoroseus pseudoceratinae]